MARLVAGTAVLAVAGALATGVSSSGARGEKTTACPKGKLCVWTDPDYTGGRLLIGTRKLSNKIFDSGFNDDVESLKLRKPGAAVLYIDTDGGAPFRVFGCNGEDRKVPDLGDDNWQFADVASSSRIRKNDHPGECSEP